ncbi:carbohydrate-binding protein [Corynebacterium sp. HMSC077B05]|uniref:carbohydrate-binding protein n=1 Tax=Corynebacterium sp. HMSC077B05 TaxID=1739252 RepID=UPI0008A21B06|nr:carbohydrate-binding protein [Corynebacterium sp. HMSC077B05]OFL77611.1 hypothetical protein HMPREF2748_03620 [Corynebacterium sp. HMSC077B05]
MTTDDLIAAIGELKTDDLRAVAEAIAWQMTSAESSEFGYWITVKLPELRETKRAAQEAKAKVVTDLRNAGTISRPVTEADAPDGFTAWEPTDTELELPMTGDRYYRVGRVWESLRDFNGAEPGLPQNWAAWRDITDEIFPPEDENAPIEYGDNRRWTAGQRATFNGITYTCRTDHYAAPGWTPVNAYAYWHKDEAAVSAAVVSEE